MTTKSKYPQHGCGRCLGNGATNLLREEMQRRLPHPSSVPSEEPLCHQHRPMLSKIGRWRHGWRTQRWIWTWAWPPGFKVSSWVCGAVTVTVYPLSRVSPYRIRKRSSAIQKLLHSNHELLHFKGCSCHQLISLTRTRSSSVLSRAVFYQSPYEI